MHLCTTEKEVTARKLKRFKVICFGALGVTCINIFLWLGVTYIALYFYDTIHFNGWNNPNSEKGSIVLMFVIIAVVN